MISKQIAIQVLDYWFAIEFLGQEEYDVCTGEKDIVENFRKFKNSDQNSRDKEKIEVFENVNTDIYSQIVNQAKECSMGTWGNLTFYIGKIRRQVCIEKIAQILGKKLEQAEENSDYIPILSFQCNANGSYIEHSFSLSPVIWAIAQLEENKSDKLFVSSLISDKVYSDTRKRMEKNFFMSDGVSENVNSAVTSDEADPTDMPAFADNAVSASKINDIYNEIVKIYGKYLPANEFVRKNAFKYHLFRDNNAKNNYDEDNYTGLRLDFFSDDLKMVKDSIEEEKFDYSTGMLSDLIDYICAPYDLKKERNRHDLIRPKDEEKFYEEISEILNIGNAPLGKWPSRFMPALMQQVAINLATSNHKKGLFAECGNIFSVNGPPGTGKTTLLKEIITNNIVEKAKILCQYNKPDDAFESVKFEYGNINGAYSKYFPDWFRFKNEQITEYGMLVTSCNNTAVENITKELPLRSGITENLKEIKEGSSPDSREMADQLKIIRDLFSTSEGEDSDIYFTDYASKLFRNNAWGLIAAPLGKKSNISDYYYNVLNPILNDLMKKNSDIEGHIDKYKEAKEKFSNQLKKVEELRKTLKNYGDVSLKSHLLNFTYDKIRKKNTVSIAEAEEEYKVLDGQLNDIGIEIDEINDIFRKHTELSKEADSKVTETEKKIQALSEQKINYLNEALNAEKSVGIFSRLFRTTRYQTAHDLAESLRSEAHRCDTDISGESQLLDEERKEADRCRNNKNETSKKLQESQELIKKLQKDQLEIKKKTEQLKREINEAKFEAEASESESEKILKDYIDAGDMKSGRILDEVFISEMLSEDEKASTKAQITNPWSTEEFNREREKLFYFALKMTKEFVLSSKSCRKNLCILGQYWGLKKENKEKIKFNEHDREAMIGSLFQTLFLLTPVISSTFASVGRLLKDVKTPGCIGTLIIDEAGQAQPQMAVGSLFRVKKAIIVGDPKQIEPVVTDDLKLLKEAYSEPALANYKSKSLSVQSCADTINPFGTFFDNETDYPDWVGCPLIVHRRCISPMYDISNSISYDGIMKQQTLLPSESKTSTFFSDKSLWIDVPGKEIGNGNHYVAEQGKKICEIVDDAFRKANNRTSELQVDSIPDLYIISPFTSVDNGLREAIKTYAKSNKNSVLAKSKSLNEWLNKNIGTVHKFQGKEANEVIFVLGCDDSQKDRYSVKHFINSNIVNVAATRAKYRFYIVGDFNVWKNNEYIERAKSIIDKQ